jgi:hypothetical protein
MDNNKIKNKIMVFDDIVDVEYQEKIKNTLMENDFAWYYISDITNPYVNKQQRPGFQHNFVLEKGEVNSPHHDLLINLIKSCCYKINVDKVNVIKGRSFMQLPLNLKNYDVDMPHIDTELEHFVIIYYVIDSDGDTIIYNEQTKGDSYTIKESITPKQGRVVMFDGRYYHTAKQPINSTRCIINYDLI